MKENKQLIQYCVDLRTPQGVCEYQAPRSSIQENVTQVHRDNDPFHILRRDEDIVVDWQTPTTSVSNSKEILQCEREFFGITKSI
jgi:hypothetical protein